MEGKKIMLERERMIITLWTFTVTFVPACPLSFCAAASLSTPSSLSPEVPKTVQNSDDISWWILGWKNYAL